MTCIKESSTFNLSLNSGAGAQTSAIEQLQVSTKSGKTSLELVLGFKSKVARCRKILLLLEAIHHFYTSWLTNHELLLSSPVLLFTDLTVLI